MQTLKWCKENPGQSPPYFTNKSAKRLIKEFTKYTKGEMLCKNITNEDFRDINDHSEFINKGGCDELIDILSSTD
ncbi:MAG: hypothetical protein KJP21_03515, partial [Bacteroidia bacterium]|nr:hypothetical protein [Bacteroidia bacterium]